MADTDAYVHLCWVKDGPDILGCFNYGPSPVELLVCTRCGAVVDSEIGIQHHERWHGLTGPRDEDDRG